MSDPPLKLRWPAQLPVVAEPAAARLQTRHLGALPAHHGRKTACMARQSSHWSAVQEPAAARAFRRIAAQRNARVVGRPPAAMTAPEEPCPEVRPAGGAAGECLHLMVRISEWTGLDLSACFGVSLFRHEIVGFKGHGQGWWWERSQGSTGREWCWQRWGRCGSVDRN